MKIQPLLIALLGSMFCSATALRAAVIPIINAGFEAPLLVDNDFTDNVIPGWIGTDTSAAFNFGVFNPPTNVFPAQAPEGLNTAYIVRGAVYQTLTTALTTGDYILTVQFGQSPDRVPSPSTIELRAGNTVLAQANTPAPADGTFTQVILNYSAVAGDALLGQLLEIRLADNDPSGNTTPFFDDVKLNFNAIPEPSSCMLIITAVVGLAVRRIR